MKKLLLSTLLLFGLTFSSFSYGVDSYTCSYKGIINSVSNKYGIPNTNYIYNCNDLGGVYDCNVYTNVNVSNGNCYQFSGFDLLSYTDINLSFDLGSTYINFSYNNNNLDMLNGYMVCSPSRIAIQGRITTYNPNPSFIITEIQESLIYNYSETYTCPTCQECQECQECPSCPSVNTGEILSGYILEDEITSGYCETRFNLISPSDCPSSGTGDIMWSSFWVNNRQVLGGRNIFLYLPDFLNWDYTYIDEDLEINVENEGDYEYMQGVIDNQTITPNKTDLNNIITGVLPLFIPGLVIILFIYFVFRFIKKIF